MKDNILTIRINKPVSEVFAFTITPPNTLKWIDSVASEETNELPVRVGTVYTLHDKKDEVSEYLVTAIKENELFELDSKDKSYHVRYVYTPVDESTTDFEYYEWVDSGNLAEPFTPETLQELKSVLESEAPRAEARGASRN